MKSDAFQLSNHAAKRIAQRNIRLDWIDLAMRSPDRVEPDSLDSALLHKLKRIEEMDGRVLRVVYNVSVVPPRVVSAYFDRKLRGQL